MIFFFFVVNEFAFLTEKCFKSLLKFCREKKKKQNTLTNRNIWEIGDLVLICYKPNPLVVILGAILPETHLSFVSVGERWQMGYSFCTPGIED